MSAATDRAAGRVMMASFLQGGAAATAARPVTDCPYDRNAPDAVTRTRARMWLRGYARVTPLPPGYSA